MLTSYGYPIQMVQIREQNADQVSEAVTGLIRERMTGSPSNQQKGGTGQ